MRAVVLREHGGPDVLQIEEVPDPVPGPEEVLVAVRATALNRADVLQRMGNYPGPPADLEIPGLELAGTVVMRGERCQQLEVDAPVMGIVGGGAYAELVVVHERQLIPVPAAVGLDDAAAIPEVFLTAWDALVVQGGLTSGRRALVHAGASGVGTAAIQLAKAIGAFVAVTCSAGKVEACRALGADWVFGRSPNDWRGEALASVPGGFDVVLDVIGGDELDRNLDVVALQGRILQVGLMGGPVTPINLGKLMAKRAGIIGTALRVRPLEQKIALSQRFTREVVPLFETGALRPVIDTRFPLDEVAEAHRHMEANANVGKILLDIGAPSLPGL
jgi:putative PIG3 family NAD(P)H quinone oxidoreductase